LIVLRTERYVIGLLIDSCIDQATLGRKIKPADIFADPDEEAEEVEKKKESERKKKREQVTKGTRIRDFRLKAGSRICFPRFLIRISNFKCMRTGNRNQRLFRSKFFDFLKTKLLFSSLPL